MFSKLFARLFKKPAPTMPKPIVRTLPLVVLAKEACLVLARAGSIKDGPYFVSIPFSALSLSLDEISARYIQPMPGSPTARQSDLFDLLRGLKPTSAYIYGNYAAVWLGAGRIGILAAKGEAAKPFLPYLMTKGPDPFKTPLTRPKEGGWMG